MLDAEETKILIDRAKAGDKDSLETLISENLPLVKSVVKRYSGKNVEYDDLMQLGSMGLLKAVLNFNDEFNVRFSTYAVPMIAGEIKRYIRDDGAVKVSRALKLLAYNIGKFSDDFQKENNREPTIDELAEEFHIDKEEVVFAHFVHEQIVYHASVRIAHHTIVHLAQRSIGNIVGKDVIYIFFCLIAGYAHFAHVRNVEYAALLTNCIVFFDYRRILYRHIKTAEGRYQSAKRFMLVI